MHERVSRVEMSVIDTPGATVVLNDDKGVAIKWAHPSTACPVEEGSTVNEVSCLKLLPGIPTIIPLLGVSVGRVITELTFPLMDGSLAEFIGDVRGDMLQDVYNTLVGACLTMEMQGVVNLDIKPENVLYTRDKSGTLAFRLADFGLGKCVYPGIKASSQALFTDGYRPPEVTGQLGEYLSADTNLYKMDVWAAGVTLLVASTGERLIADEYETNASAIRTRASSMTREEWFLAMKDQSFHGPLMDTLRAPLREMLQVNPADRSTASELAIELQPVQSSDKPWTWLPTGELPAMSIVYRRRYVYAPGIEEIRRMYKRNVTSAVLAIELFTRATTIDDSFETLLHAIACVLLVEKMTDGADKAVYCDDQVTLFRAVEYQLFNPAVRVALERRPSSTSLARNDYTRPVTEWFS